MEDGNLGEVDGLIFCLARAQDYKEVLGISDDIYEGNDYLPIRYHSWMSEQDRVVILAKRAGKLVALESGLVVDGGLTVVVEGLRVCPSERGRGVAGILQRFAEKYIQRLYPNVKIQRLTRGDDPGPEKLAKFTLLERRAILSLRGEADSFNTFLSNLKVKLNAGEEAGRSVPQPEPKMVALGEGELLRAVLMDPEIASRVQLPGGAVIQDWQPLKPIESNLKIWQRRRLTWLADREKRPHFLSLHTPPYQVPFNGGSMRLNIDLFGTSPVLARRAALSHLERAKDGLRGTVLVHMYMHRSLWEEMREFCDCPGGVRRCKGFWEQLFLEREI